MEIEPGTQDAVQQAKDALMAFRSSSRPTVPMGAALVSSIATGAGVAILGQPGGGWARLGLLVLAAVLLLGGATVPAYLRSRSGVHGYRGQVRRDNLVFIICAVALFVCGLGADSTLGAIYLGIGVVVAIAWFLLLRNRFGQPEAML